MKIIQYDITFLYKKCYLGLLLKRFLASITFYV